MSDYTQENYKAYCEMIRTEYPTLIPSGYDDWVVFNETMDANKRRERDHWENA